mmetsp:Transcript_13815/g.28010  ORF Transcript_13815/g.28010 Transcript_13815/m.28010 type:complete len:205 (-) Transcript_13815:49-663(-)|eukprot:CAMPEP_0119058224 /NCGR_PEP_ID=MMETSP1178-20130426/2593_1 /TAXON_ID=33656 /ORGANISM="unid sp, Strain CCMP2000" /LENGTH=204 /DNA_ID=CAMNT_0007039133 /DNA_START=28 /DNA_END=642 /DNA_ORIENTATION=-
MSTDATADPAASSDGPAVVVAVAVPADDAYEAKYERMKKVAQFWNLAASALLTFVAGKALFYDDDSQNCNPMLVRVVMGWMAVLGFLLFLSELGVEKVRTYLHLLSYRSGRAAVALMIGSICVAAAPTELPIGTMGAGVSVQGNYVKQFKWEYLVIGLVVILGAFYNIRLTVRSKAHKLTHRRNKVVEGKATEVEGKATEHEMM